MLPGKGVKAISVMWAMTGVSFILVPLRLYTRIFIVKALGVDDHVFVLAWVSVCLTAVLDFATLIAYWDVDISVPLHPVSHDSS